MNLPLEVLFGTLTFQMNELASIRQCHTANLLRPGWVWVGGEGGGASTLTTQYNRLNKSDVAIPLSAVAQLTLCIRYAIVAIVAAEAVRCTRRIARIPSVLT